MNWLVIILSYVYVTINRSIQRKWETQTDSSNQNILVIIAAEFIKHSVLSFSFAYSFSWSTQHVVFLAIFFSYFSVQHIHILYNIYVMYMKITSKHKPQTKHRVYIVKKMCNGMNIALTLIFSSFRPQCEKTQSL